MKRRPCDPPPSRPDDAELERLLLDRRHGGLDRDGARRLEALVRAGEDAARLRVLEGFLARIRDAHVEAADPEQAAAVSARIRSAVGAEETRAVRAAGGGPRRRRLVWARVVAVSVAVHVVLLGVVLVEMRRDAEEKGPRRITVSFREPLPPLADRGTEDRPSSPWLPSIGEDRAPVLPAEAPGNAGVATLPEDLDPIGTHRFDHPTGVLGPMRNRLEEPRKRDRLRRAGFDENLTLAAVSRGLRALSHRQHADGSFAASPERGPLAQTALALLPFLGDGHSSRQGTYSTTVVAPGIAWLRQRVFDDGGAVRADVGAEAAALGITLKALSEDYMLSYGRLLPKEGQRRAGEIARLTERVSALQRNDGSFRGTESDLALAVWPMWGLDAATRTGVVVPPDEVALRFARWFERVEEGTPEGDAAGLLLARHLGRAFRDRAEALASRVVERGWEGLDRPFVVATASTGLLREDPQAFRTWSQGLDDKLASRLGPSGTVRRGDPVGDTALVLLTLQAAYRTF
jgi:hypothetical protein